MRYAILSNIHGNYRALRAIEGELEQSNIHQVCCLGDLVGYGPEPRQCVRKVMESQWLCVRGDFDSLVLEGPSWWSMKSREVRESLEKAQGELGQSERDFLASLPYVIHQPFFSLVHASLYHPSNYQGIHFPLDSRLCFQQFKSSLCFYGHTHEQRVFFQDGSQIFSAHPPRVSLKQNWKILINPGSVGWSSEKKLSPSFAILDTELQEVVFRQMATP